MSDTKENNQFPQYLCKMCGRCCKSITTSYNIDELKKMADEGSEEARVFIEIFKQYPSIEAAKEVVPDQVEQVLDELKNAEGVDINKVIFYHCPHLQKDNKCGIYEKRPECCKRAPTGPWACMPPGCGFEGWQFEEREKIKHKVRKLKEYIIAAEAVGQENIEELKQALKKKIEPWVKYGAEYW